jgi:protein-S-isoprenylcysteine O-methyltransferase Ste14
MAHSLPPDKITARKAQFYNLFFICYLAAMLLCLRQWHGPHPWSRLDRFSGGYIVLSILWLEASRGFLRTFLRRNEISGELSGASYDRWTLRFTMILPIIELSVFLDYGHWHLMPALAQPALQWAGLALSLLGALLLLWADRQLLAHFSGDMTRPEVMEAGPYRFARHPRYLALILSRVSFALALASPLGWAFALLWFLMLARRIRLEEAHLRKIFGPDYATYSRRTSRPSSPASSSR